MRGNISNKRVLKSEHGAHIIHEVISARIEGIKVNINKNSGLHEQKLKGVGADDEDIKNYRASKQRLIKKMSKDQRLIENSLIDHFEAEGRSLPGLIFLLNGNGFDVDETIIRDMLQEAGYENVLDDGTDTQADRENLGVVTVE